MNLKEQVTSWFTKRKMRVTIPKSVSHNDFVVQVYVSSLKGKTWQDLLQPLVEAFPDHKFAYKYTKTLFLVFSISPKTKR